MCWVLGMGSASLAFGAEPLKIGYVDMQRALNQCEEGQEAKKTITAEVDKMQKTFGAKQKELEKIKDDLQKRGSVMNESVRREKEKEYQAKAVDLQRLQRDFEEDIRRKDQEHTERVLRNLANVVRKMGEEGKYTIILEKNQPTIIYISGALDLTDEVIKLSNQKPK